MIVVLLHNQLMGRPSYLLQVRLGLEPLLYKHGVDLAMWAHEHEYQRIYPMYNYTLCKGSEADPYANPRATVHIISGSAVSQA